MLNTYISSSADINMIIACCHSGSAIDDLSSTGRMIITTCTSDQSSYLYDPDGVPTWEAFSKPFWDKIKDYQTVKDAFNHACWHIKNVQDIQNQDPLLDDNGDDTGHTGPLPNGGDGNVASNLHIGLHEYICVGGVWVPVDKFGLLAPYIGLASTILVATAATTIYVKRIRRRKEE
jgi:hypothetical protein